MSNPSSSVPSLTNSELKTFRRIYCSDRKATIAFAHYSTNPVLPQFIVSDVFSAQPCRWFRLGEFDDIFQYPHILSSYLRYSRTIASFSLYPETPHDLAVNRVLWRTAQRGEYLPTEGNMLLQNNVFSVSMPQQFHSFLADVTEKQLNICMLEILTLIAEDEDQQGFDLMQSELHDSIWNDLLKYIHSQPQRHIALEQVTRNGVMLSTYVEMLFKQCYHSSWKVDVHTAYIPPKAMMSALLTVSSKSSVKLQTLPPYEYDRKLVRSPGKRPVSSPALQVSSSSRLSSNFANRNLVSWKLFQDWRRYRWMLVHLLGVSPREATETMLNSISQGTQGKAWEQVEAVTRAFLGLCGTHPNDSLMTSLPEDVVSTKIAPFVLLNESNG